MKPVLNVHWGRKGIFKQQYKTIFNITVSVKIPWYFPKLCNMGGEK